MNLTCRTAVAVYLGVQAAAVFAWWSLLLLVPGAVALFQPASFGRECLMAFMLPDIAILGVGSLVVAAAVARNLAWAAQGIACLAAAAWFAALYCLAASLQTGEAWLAAALMVTMAGLLLAAASVYGFGAQKPQVFRAATMTRNKTIAWTLIQMTTFWTVFLWIIPLGVVEIEGRIGLVSFQHAGQTPASWLLFAAAGSLGIWSAMTMACCGCGTPMPTATAPNLVVRGPYHMLRNPMALAGVSQGLSIGWLLGSPAVVGGSLLAGLGWHVLIRPAEEADLHARFGVDYAHYRRCVPLWIPRFGLARPGKRAEFAVCSQVVETRSNSV